MSSGAAIAACTAVLQHLFTEAVVGSQLASALGSTPAVTALAPDRVTVGAGEGPQLNVFLYNVTRNPGWCNAELPSHDRAGTRLTAAPAALDLDYVVSAYGAGSAHADVLLGHAALVVHTTRYLTRERIRAIASDTSVAAPLRAVLAASGLDEQEEQIRLSPAPLAIDDISKLWSVFGDRYRSSIAFTASLVLLRPDERSRPARPVAVPNLRVLALPIPGIDRAEPDLVEVGDSLTLHGHGLLGDTTTVHIGEATAAPVAGATPARVEVVVPASVRAGLAPVRVVHAADFAPASGAREVLDSNAVPVTVRPRIARTGGAPVITPTGITTAGGRVTGGSVTIRLNPVVGREQRVRVMLHGTGAGPPTQYVLEAPSRALDPVPTSATITIDPVGVRTGSYLVSVEVDGVSSRLTHDPAANTYTGPVVTL